jgi:hypothetical protein
VPKMSKKRAFSPFVLAMLMFVGFQDKRSLVY